MNHQELSERETSIEAIERLGIAALQNAFRAHNKLAEEGLKDIPVNPYRTTIKGDMKAELAVIDTLVNGDFLFLIHSEENGIVKIKNGDRPLEYLAVLDGIDGTKSYKENFGKGRYATLFGIFSKTDPTYNDYLFSGIMEHATGKLFYAVKGKGAFVLKDRVKTRIHCSTKDVLDSGNSVINADTNFDSAFHVHVVGEVADKLPGFDIRLDDSSGAHYANLAFGAVDAVIECTRKDNLEMAAAYGLVVESGGIMVTLDGKSWGDQKYLTFGQDDHIPVISAANPSIAADILKRFSSPN
jgi:fructose-1,6-bisphosphatase/inositol monophosphatase family enzyme